MNIHAHKTRENKSQSAANSVSSNKRYAESAFQFVDNRPEAIVQRRLQEMVNNSPHIKQQKRFQKDIELGDKTNYLPIQRKITVAGKAYGTETRPKDKIDNWDDLTQEQRRKISSWLEADKRKYAFGNWDHVKFEAIEAVNRLDYLKPREFEGNPTERGKRINREQNKSDQAALNDIKNAQLEVEMQVRQEKLRKLIIKNDNLIKVARDKVKFVRRVPTQWNFNAGQNPGIEIIEGGSENPILLDKGTQPDIFGLLSVATNLEGSFSANAKRRFKHSSYPDIFIHVK